MKTHKKEGYHHSSQKPVALAMPSEIQNTKMDTCQNVSSLR